jgi:cytochrome d ubiquinol oxidase subunit I
MRTARLRGLNDFEGAHPPVAPLFFAFRCMVGIGHADAAR